MLAQIMMLMLLMIQTYIYVENIIGSNLYWCPHRRSQPSVFKVLLHLLALGNFFFQHVRFVCHVLLDNASFQGHPDSCGVNLCHCRSLIIPRSDRVSDTEGAEIRGGGGHGGWGRFNFKLLF